MNWRISFCFIAGFVAFLLLPHGTADGQEETDVRLQKILADWKKRRSYPPVQYEVQGKSVSLKENVVEYNTSKKRAPPFEPKDTNLEWNVRLLLDVKTQRHKFEEERDIFNVSKGKATREITVTAFDGAMMTSKARKNVDGKETKLYQDSPDVAITTGNLAGFLFSGQLAPLFASHGAVAFPPQEFLIPGKLDSDPDTSLMTVHGKDVFEGHVCIVIRSYPGGDKNFQEFWIDASRESALLRWISYGGGFPGLEFQARYQKQGPFWLVNSWTYEIRSSSVYRFNVVKTTVLTEVAESEFRLPIEPGMLVTRGHNPPDKNPLKKDGAGKREHYRVDASGQEAPVYFEKGVEYPRSNLAFWLVGGALVAALSLIAFAGRRWRKGRASAKLNRALSK